MSAAVVKFNHTLRVSLPGYGDSYGDGVPLTMFHKKYLLTSLKKVRMNTNIARRQSTPSKAQH